jgi:hypothetical protein
VSGLDTLAMQRPFKVGAKLYPMVTLHHGEVKAKVLLGFQDYLRRNTRSNLRSYGDVGHSAVQVNNRVQVDPLSGSQVNEVNRIGLD